MTSHSNTKILVIDDDPTGSQTVHGCLLLTRWDPQTPIGDEALAEAYEILAGSKPRQV